MAGWWMLLATSAAVTAQTPQWTPEAGHRVKQIGSPDPSPDGERVAFQVGTPLTQGDKSEVLQQVYLAPARGGGPARQLTFGDRSSFAPAWSPDGSQIAFLSARSGRVNLWRIRPDGGEPEQLTDETGRVSLFKWSPDGSRIAFLMTDPESEEDLTARRERRDWRVVGERYPMARLRLITVTGAAGPRPSRVLTPATMNLGFAMIQSIISFTFDWSPDGRTIAFTHTPTPDLDDWVSNDLSVVDTESGAIRSLVATGATEFGASYSPDGRWIAYLASDDPPTYGFTYRVRLVPAGGGATRPLADTYDSKATLIGWLDDDRVLVHEPRGTENRLYALPRSGGPAAEFSGPGLTPGYPSISRSGKHLAVVLQAVDRAPELFVSPTDVYRPVQATRLQDADLPAPPRTEVVTWSSSDGKRIEGLLTYPIGYQPGNRVPLIVGLHGGPTGVITQTYVGSAQIYNVAAFAARGFAVLQPNFRGSAGYGRAFRYANYRDWGGGDYRDVMSGVDDLIRRGIADPDRLGVMGWSYGGFLTSSIIGQTTRFKAASAGAAIIDLVSYAGTADMRGFVPDYLGEFWDAPDLWRARNPILAVKNITTPVLIQHGEADARVPVSQGYELFEALRTLKRPVRMVVYPRQGHLVAEPKFQLHLNHDNLDWFSRWLLP